MLCRFEKYEYDVKQVSPLIKKKKMKKQNQKPPNPAKMGREWGTQTQN